MQRLVAFRIARLMRAFTNPLTAEYGCSHFAVSQSAICLSRFLASRPIKPSVETTNGTNDRRRSQTREYSLLGKGKRIPPIVDQE
jgi:hypothetical protein